MLGKEVKRQKMERLEKGKVEDESFQGPWAPFKQDAFLFESQPVADDYVPQPVFDASKVSEQKMVETSVFHGKEERDYLGRSFLHPSTDLAMKLKGTGAVAENFIPKQLVHTWTGHTKVTLRSVTGG